MTAAAIMSNFFHWSVGNSLLFSGQNQSKPEEEHHHTWWERASLKTANRFRMSRIFAWSEATNWSCPWTNKFIAFLLFVQCSWSSWRSQSQASKRGRWLFLCTSYMGPNPRTRSCGRNAPESWFSLIASSTNFFTVLTSLLQLQHWTMSSSMSMSKSSREIIKPSKNLKHADRMFA